MICHTNESHRRPERIVVHLGKRWELIQRLEIAAAVKIAAGVARVVAAAEEA